MVGLGTEALMVVSCRQIGMDSKEIVLTLESDGCNEERLNVEWLTWLNSTPRDVFVLHVFPLSSWLQFVVDPAHFMTDPHAPLAPAPVKGKFDGVVIKSSPLLLPVLIAPAQVHARFRLLPETSRSMQPTSRQTHMLH